jgi:hypothetical protein
MAKLFFSTFGSVRLANLIFVVGNSSNMFDSYCSSFTCFDKVLLQFIQSNAKYFGRQCHFLTNFEILNCNLYII